MTTVTTYTPTVSATLNGGPITGVRKARVVSSFSTPVSSIYLSVYPAVSWSEGDTLAVTMGSGTNNVLSGTGTIYEADYSNTGPTYELIARGPLFKAKRYQNNVSGGLTLTALTGGPATDEAIAKAVLDIAGITYTPSDIGGTGLTRGSLAPTAYTWRQGETALDYLSRLGKASLGYRMVETIGGEVQRVKVVGRPATIADFTLTQGVDIFGGGKTQFDAFGHFTAVTVTGYDYGDGNGPISYSWPIPIPAGVAPYVFSSEMIERVYESDPGGGVSAANVALNFVLPEVDRVAIRVSSIKTPRDDLFEPGQTHAITADWLGLNNEFLWCMSVTRECDERWFTQTMEYIGGGVASGPFDIPYGKSTLLDNTMVRTRSRRRISNWSYIYQAQLPVLIGQDVFPPGQQVRSDRSRATPRQPAGQDRSHGGIFGALTPP